MLLGFIFVFFLREAYQQNLYPLLHSVSCIVFLFKFLKKGGIGKLVQKDINNLNLAEKARLIEIPVTVFVKMQNASSTYLH